VINQLLASLTLVVLSTWQARRGKPVLPTLIPLVFLSLIVGWAAVSQMKDLLNEAAIPWHQVIILGFGMLVQVWMLIEGWLALTGAVGAGKVDKDGIVHSETV
jgi:carbon starvation protein